VAAGAALTAWQDLVRAHPDLPSVDLDSDAAVEERFRSVEAAASAAADAERRANDTVLEAQRALARSQGAAVVNLAATSQAIEEAEAAAARLREEIVALTLAYRELTAAVEEFRRDHRQRLEERASAYLVRFAAVDGRRVVLGDEFAASVREPSGDVAVPAQLSQGARDQLALSLRLAVADLVGDDVALPLVFDDPFLHWDADRLARVREALTTLAADRQVLVFSHRPSVAAWGTPVERSGGGRPA
jgi:chromosome segregation protein